mmetsp:Transcript_101437/g.257959  ORF Transcript_101437/g.257959 Transcript_101437/m.257959 type:complete len:153 (+) Transcript_101437:586-1044(+)
MLPRARCQRDCGSAAAAPESSPAPAPPSAAATAAGPAQLWTRRRRARGPPPPPEEEGEEEAEQLRPAMPAQSRRASRTGTISAAAARPAVPDALNRREAAPRDQHWCLRAIALYEAVNGRNRAGAQAGNEAASDMNQRSATCGHQDRELSDT